MRRQRLSLACWDYDRTRPLIDGRVVPEGIDLDVTVARPRQVFPRMLEGREFDVAEMSLASYTTLTGRGANPFVAIPVVVSKIFRHSCIYVRTGSGIERPEDLRGTRVGTTQLGSTAVVFINGMLEEEHGVRPRDLRWVIGGLTGPTQRPLVPLDLPGHTHRDFLPADRTLEGEFAAGRLDALFSIYLPQLFLDGSPSIRRLFPDFRTAEEHYFRSTGIFPIMHTIAIRRELHERDPSIAPRLYDAFVRAGEIAQHELYDTDALRVSLPWLIDHVEEARRVFGSDVWAHGLEENRPAWEAIGRFVHAQGLSPRVVSPDELFVDHR